MARKPRLHVPGGLYHVILRGNDRQNVFFNAQDRARFYELIAEGVVRFDYRVHAFCLMTNHLHLALQAGDVPLSAAMQNLAFRYTRHVNHRRKRAGHLFQARFKAYLVDQDRYGLALVRYLHLNPVRAGLVKDPSAYPYSSHRAYLGQQTLSWLTTEWVMGQFANTAARARERYAEFINARKTQGHQDFFYGGKADARVVGEEDFVRGVLKLKASTVRPPQLQALVAHVCRSYDLRKTELLAEGRARMPAEARTVVAWLALKTHAASLSALAQYFGRDISTLSHALARLDARSRNSKAFANILNRQLYAIAKPDPTLPAMLDLTVRELD